MPPFSNDNLSVELTIVDGQASIAIDKQKKDLVDLESMWARLGVSGRRTFDTIGAQAPGAANAIKLTSHQAANLSYQINDIATGLAMGQSPFQIMAQQGGQVIQVFGGLNGTLAATRTGLASIGLSLGSLGIFAGVAAAGYAVVKVTENIRTEAERRLKAEIAIVGAMNKQILLGQELDAKFKSQLNNDDKDRRFSDFLEGASLSDVESRLANLKKLRDLGSTLDFDSKKGDWVQSSESRRTESEIRRLEDQKAALIKQRGGSADKSFSESWDAMLRSQEAAKKAQEEFNRSVEDGKKRVEELGKKWNEGFVNSFTKFHDDNPFIKFMSDSARAASSLNDQLKGLPPQIAAVAKEMQRAASLRDAFSLRLDNALGAANLRSEAEKFRNPYDPGKDSSLYRSLMERQYGRPVGTDKDGKPVYDTAGRNTEAGDAYVKRSFEALRQKTPQEQTNKSLSEQYDLIYDKRRPGFDQAIADRKWIAATQGVNPAELSSSLRNSAADARLNEAARKESLETEAQTAQVALYEMLKQISTQEGLLVKVAETGGRAAVDKLTVEVKDSTGNGLSVTRNPERPTNADTQRTYDLELTSGFGGLTNR